MAVMTGHSETTVSKLCSPYVLGGLENCTFIWKLFREYGYVTAYGEDMTQCNSFTYLKKGFIQPPVDYYLRPHFIGVDERIDKIRLKSKYYGCMGSQHSIEMVYDYAIELAKRYPNEPYFGLFWTNTLSHNYISTSSALDEKMIDYLERLVELDAMNHTIVVFLSDHGLRFGPSLKLFSSYYEERLPFLFLWLPPHLKQTHPEIVNALNVNKNRLTNHYDLHMTLKHVLELSGRVTVVPDPPLLQPLKDCPRCQTLFVPVAHNRTCSDVAIEDHWCTCIPFLNITKNTETIRHIAQLIVNYINEFIANFKNGSIAKLCVPLELGKTEKSYYTNIATNGSIDNSITTYRITFYTKPNNALFEATVRYNTKSDSLQIASEISRLNSYESDASCIQDDEAKKYCSCHKK